MQRPRDAGMHTLQAILLGQSRADLLLVGRRNENHVIATQLIQAL